MSTGSVTVTIAADFSPITLAKAIMLPRVLDGRRRARAVARRTMGGGRSLGTPIVLS